MNHSPAKLQHPTSPSSHFNGGGLPHPTYRADIDGLRAVAVLSVLGYHAFPNWISGGFVGVDVFFIISGFLISSILLSSLERGTFSLITFYVRRILRIFPALLVVLVTCFVVGWFGLLASEFTQLGKHIAAGAGFISNLALWRETGYFDKAAESKPLLHLWSLGIEEQFYIVWPLLLYLSWKLRFRPLPVIFLILLGSFAINLEYVHTDTAGAFYSPLARFWELLIGGCLAYLSLHETTWLIAVKQTVDAWIGRATHESSAQRRLALRRNVQTSVGGGMILLSIVLLNRRTVFPGWWALMPTVGAALVIGAGSDAWLNRWALSRRLMVLIGVISYPLYLWHWPLLSFAQIIEGTKPAWWLRALLMASSLLLATATYWIVEKPLRFGTHKNMIAAALLAAMMGVGLTGYETYTHYGFSFRATAKASVETAIADKDQSIRGKYPVRSCNDERVVGRAKSICTQSVDSANTTRGVLVIWGDSQAEAWAPVFLQIAKENNYKTIIFSALGCPPLLQVRRSDNLGFTDCSKLGLGEDVVASIQRIHPNQVVVVARWSLYANGLYQDGTLRETTHFLTTSATAAATLNTSRTSLTSQLRPTIDALLAASTGNVLVLKNLPILKSGIGIGLLRRRDSFEPSTDENSSVEKFGGQLIDSLRSLPRVKIFDPTPYLCSDKCSAFYSGEAMYTDDNHVSAQGAMLFKDVLSADLD